MEKYSLYIIRNELSNLQKKLFLTNKGNKINKIEKKYVGCFHAAAIHVVISVLLFLLDEMWYHFNKINFRIK